MEHRILADLIENLLHENASDLHLSEGKIPVMRVEGSLVPLEKYSALAPADIKAILDELLTQKQKEKFHKRI